jgi:hypothetical protein
MTVKLPLVAAVTFVVALGGSAGLRIATAPAAMPDSAAAPASDTLAAPGHERADTGNGAGTDSAHAVPESGPAPAPITAGTTKPEDSASKQVVPAIGRIPEAGHPKPDFPRLAKLLSVMPVALAAERIALLTDAEVEGILRVLGPRQGAALLAAMPKERAATLARRLLVPRDSGAGR